MATSGHVENFNWPHLCNGLSTSLYVCTQTILCPRTLYRLEAYDRKLDPYFAIEGKQPTYIIRRKNEAADLEK